MPKSGRNSKPKNAFKCKSQPGTIYKIMAFNIDEFVQKYTVHPETELYLRARVEDGGRPYTELGVVEARKASLAGAQKYGGTVELDGTETELPVPCTSEGDGIPVTVFKSKSCDTMSSPAILVYYHGGGNTIGSRKTHETVCKILARDTPCIVVTVEYRMGPEHKFPANNDDARDVVDWLAEHKTSVGGSSSSKLGVLGDSAGGRLAAVVCHERRKLVDFAVLIYPNVSMRFEHASVQEFNAGPLLSWSVIEWFIGQYGITSENIDHPRASPLRATDFSALPPTQIIVAELDPLRDGCYAYCEKMKEGGNVVELVTIRGVPHAFWHIPGAFKENCEVAYKSAIGFIRRYS